MPEQKFEPLVSMRDIERLAWHTSKKVKDGDVAIVTKFGFEAEPTADQLKILHLLLQNGGPLSVTFRSPKIQMELELESIEQSKAEAGERTERQ